QKDMVLLAQGDFQQSGLVGQKTEIQNIIDEFNKLTISLRVRDEEVTRKTEALKTEISERKKAEEKLEKHREHLEELVKERTSELKEKNTELERMNEVFTGREFRVKELRDRVKELEKNQG
ncbi:MAG: hypothetical protein KAR13_16135, partial [Desulfobulbaceae bacterium]|nr:hypothetical protein [Desulfobulbaceae bacterium]